MFDIAPALPAEAGAIQQIIAAAFGPGYAERPIQRLRAGVAPAPGLSFVIREDEVLRGCLKFWPVAIDGDRPALLLGPLAVEPAERGRGLGVALVRHGLAAARCRGHEIVFVSGEPDYYARFGFRPAAEFGVRPTVAVAPLTFQVLGLSPSAWHGLDGTVDAWRGVRRSGAAPQEDSVTPDRLSLAAG